MIAPLLVTVKDDIRSAVVVAEPRGRVGRGGARFFRLAWHSRGVRGLDLFSGGAGGFEETRRVPDVGAVHFGAPPKRQVPTGSPVAPCA